MKSDCNCQYIPLDQTGYFTKIVTDYINGSSELKPFYDFNADDEGLGHAINKRENYTVDRHVLVEALRKQYQHLEIADIVNDNIEKLKDENTFTICTAHQPNLLGGYLYFIYKIMHAVKLSRHLKNKFPQKNFVPVFYIGSEDNDFEELSVFRYNNKKYQWITDQQGAVGRMNTQSLKTLLDELFATLGPPGIHEEQLKEIIIDAYQKQPTIATATRYLVNALMGQYGVVVLDPDDADFKRQFIPIIKEELLQPKAFQIVSKTSQELSEKYKSQAYVRPINFFYLKDNIRERIEKSGDKWIVVNTDIMFDEAALLEEVDSHPEHFSPNVILRGLFQEAILPNVAFIGGGSEVAYWLQLKDIFKEYNIFYPAIILRQSVLWISKDAQKRMQQLGYNNNDLFSSILVLQDKMIESKSDYDFNLEEEHIELIKIISDIKNKAIKIDTILNNSSDAVLSKIKYQISILENKMKRAAKKKLDVEMKRIEVLKQKLFPNDSLQERYDSFLQYYISYGADFFDTLLRCTMPYGDRFLIIQNKELIPS